MKEDLDMDGRNLMGKPDINGRIILKWILNK
jgi:hypothetical protein